MLNPKAKATPYWPHPYGDMNIRTSVHPVGMWWEGREKSVGEGRKGKPAGMRKKGGPLASSPCLWAINNDAI